jgi:signal transduction histidine kinase
LVSETKALLQLRARIVMSGARAAAGVGVVAWIASVAASLSVGLVWLAVLDTVLYAWVLSIRVAPQTTSSRGLQLVLLLHIVGTVLLFALGPFGHGVMWELTATVLAGLYLGPRAAKLSFAFQLLSAAAFAVFYRFFPPDVERYSSGSPVLGFLAFATSGLLLAAALAVPLARMLKGLEEALERTRTLHARQLQEADERRALEKQLAQALKLEAMGRMASGIAHDFGNLLMPLMSFADAARASLDRDHPARADVDEVVFAAERARDLVAQLLSFCRNPADVTARAPIALGTVIHEMSGLLHATTGSDVKITIDVDTALLVHANASELQQVVLNLASNAAHAMRANANATQPHALTLIARATAAAPPAAREHTAGAGFVRLDVRDTGCGMDEATLARIFEPFFTTKTAGLGTGLGLAGVHGIVASMSGAVTVSSTLGVGTTFSLFFPRVAP